MGINGINRYKNLLRFTTAGSGDDGKSTLIGRLLYDRVILLLLVQG
jgi:sulfate adenylyltransferase subunit 1 (EFTu-like GTPase family)